MEFLLGLYINGKLFGIEWHPWKVVGWLGNAVFFSRFFVQWLATERRKQVVVPPAFWWLSLIGSSLLLAYGLYRRDSVFIFAYLFTWIPYIRNLVITYRSKRAEETCPACEGVSPPRARYCPACGQALPGAAGEG
ncbi:MAG TPA: lipid-A-disaccharide synthase N-terminal domain-containing protein [Methylomirabilota bacterium]|nr:lipid-A-disaccharide synthase N-terminal domain-containing protein [Methylomirabilota bacterium]